MKEYKFVDGKLQDENGNRVDFERLAKECQDNGMKIERTQETRQVYRHSKDGLVKEPEEILCDVIKITE